jgi:hypothetical protein
MNREKEEYRKGRRVVERELILMKFSFCFLFGGDENLDEKYWG